MAVSDPSHGPSQSYHSMATVTSLGSGIAGLTVLQRQPPYEGRGTTGVGTCDCRGQAGTGNGSTSLLANRASGHEKWWGTIQTKNQDFLTRCVPFATSPRITRRRCCSMGIATQTSRLNSPRSWPRSWNAVESGTNSLRYRAGDICSTGTCRTDDHSCLRRVLSFLKEQLGRSCRRTRPNPRCTDGADVPEPPPVNARR